MSTKEKEDSFNSKYFPDDMLIKIGAIRGNAFPLVRYNQRYLSTEYSYQCPDGIFRSIYVTDKNGYVEIIIPFKNEVLKRPKSSDIYTCFIGGGDPNAINDLDENDPMFKEDSQDPKIDIAQFLENDEPHLKELSLLSFIEPDSFTANLIQHLSDVCNIPSSTTFLVTLASFSAMTSMRYNCYGYDNDCEEGKIFSTSEYVLAQQSDCKDNSILQNLTVAPMKKMIVKNLDLKYKEKQKYEAESLTSSTKSELEEENLKFKFNEHVDSLFYLKPITNDATPQALKSVLKLTNGVITVISTNPALINSLFVSSGKQSNTDLLLVGREGRSNGYNGHCSATICCFAQKNVVPQVMKAADASGVLELFKVIAEPNRVGVRNYLELDKKLLKIYEQKCSFFKKVLINGFDRDNLITLHISHCDWLNIRHFENEFESQSKDGGKYADPTLRRFIGKIRMQVISLACNLFLLEEEAPDESCYVPSKYVLSAIQMMKQLIDGLYTYCVGRNIISNNEQIKFIFDLVVEHKDGLAMREIKEKCEGVHPFKDLPSDSKRIQEVVSFLASNNVLLRSRYSSSYIKNPLIV
jgi:hypothetical protein